MNRMTLDHVASSCTTYATCGVLLNSDINWGAVGAALLLVARLIKDVPDAIKTIKSYMKKRKKKNKPKKKKKK